MNEINDSAKSYSESRIVEVTGVVRALEGMLALKTNDRLVEIVLPRMIKNINHYKSEHHSSVVDSGSLRIEIDMAADRLTRKMGVSYQEAQRAVTRLLEGQGQYAEFRSISEESGILKLLSQEE